MRREGIAAPTGPRLVGELVSPRHSCPHLARATSARPPLGLFCLDLGRSTPRWPSSSRAASPGLRPTSCCPATSPPAPSCSSCAGRVGRARRGSLCSGADVAPPRLLSRLGPLLRAPEHRLGKGRGLTSSLAHAWAPAGGLVGVSVALSASLPLQALQPELKDIYQELLSSDGKELFLTAPSLYLSEGEALGDLSFAALYQRCRTPPPPPRPRAPAPQGLRLTRVPMAPRAWLSARVRGEVALGVQRGGEEQARCFRSREPASSCALVPCAARFPSRGAGARAQPEEERRAAPRADRPGRGARGRLLRRNGRGGM